jgi:hypothetical protein
MLAFVVFLAMICSCMASGISGAIIPLTLKRFGLDPATASSIFLTTATDVVSMGMLGLATLATMPGALDVDHLARHAAVDDEVLPGDEAGGVRQQIGAPARRRPGRGRRGPTGCWAWSFLRTGWCAIQPGLTQFTRISGPRLLASACVSATRPPLLAL